MRTELTGSYESMSPWDIVASCMHRSLLQEFGECSEDANNMAAVATKVRLGLLSTPCDVVHTPMSMLCAIRRVQAGIPEVTPFKVLEQARRDLKSAHDQLLQLGVHDDEKRLH
jgi:hypothetical protein